MSVGEEAAAEDQPPAAAGAAAEAGDQAEDDDAVTLLPAAVRQRVIELCAECLPRLDFEAIPPSLRPVARFTAARRARLGATLIAAALESDPAFRDRVAQQVREASPELIDALESGKRLPTASPDELAAVGYLLRTPDWQRLAAAAGVEADRRRVSAAAAETEGTIGRLQEELDRVRADGRTEAARLRADLVAGRAEADELRRRLREVGERLRRAESAEQTAAAERAADREAATAAVAAAESESRRLRNRLADAEASLDAARRSTRESRAVDEVRLYLLLDTVVRAAQGLRQELALAPPMERPADLVGQDVEPGPEIAARAYAEDDPALVDQLLTLPNAHLIVDGYNVTMAGFPALPLEAQRTRLVTGLGGLSARTGAEVTCVFDGAERPTPVAAPTPRQVRVRFSAPGETADEVIRRLVRGEPPARVVVVASADREVVDGVRAAGAYLLSPAALLRRLDRA